jgi:hypothetical protein
MPEAQQHLQQGEYLRRMSSESGGRKSMGYQQYGQAPQPQSLQGGMMPQQHSSHSRDFHQAAALSFTDEDILKRMKGLINEYLRLCKWAYYYPLQDF